MARERPVSDAAVAGNGDRLCLLPLSLSLSRSLSLSLPPRSLSLCLSRGRGCSSSVASLVYADDRGEYGSPVE